MDIPQVAEDDGKQSSELVIKRHVYLQPADASTQCIVAPVRIWPSTACEVAEAGELVLGCLHQRVVDHEAYLYKMPMEAMDDLAKEHSEVVA